MVLLLKKCLLRPNYEVFWQKNQETFQIGKIRKYDEEGVFFREKKRFHLFKSFLYKNGKTQNIPVVAGRLVVISSLLYSK